LVGLALMLGHNWADSLTVAQLVRFDCKFYRSVLSILACCQFFVGVRDAARESWRAFVRAVFPSRSDQPLGTLTKRVRMRRQ